MSFGIAVADKQLEDSLTPQKIQELNSEMTKLRDLQARIDAAIDQLPDGADKQRVIQKRAEARGYFDAYVLPAYMKVYNLAKSVEGSAGGMVDSIKEWWSGLFSGEDCYGSDVSFDKKLFMSAQMGFALPVIPVAYVAAAGILALATTAIYYIKTQNDREMKILDDPAFSAKQKADLIGGGTLSGILKNAQVLALTVGVVGIIYLVMKNKSKE